MHHKRVVQEKNRLITDIKRYLITCTCLNWHKSSLYVYCWTLQSDVRHMQVDCYLSALHQFPKKNIKGIKTFEATDLLLSIYQNNDVLVESFESKQNWWTKIEPKNFL